jgi:DNA polymerase eta
MRRAVCPVCVLQGFGGKLGDEVESFAGAEVTTIGGLTGKFSCSQLCARFGPECGVWMWRVCHGVDDDPVKPVERIKTFGASKNVPNTTTLAQAAEHLRVVCVELVERIQSDYAQWRRFPTLLGVSYRARRPHEYVLADGGVCVRSCPLPHATDRVCVRWT